MAAMNLSVGSYGEVVDGSIIGSDAADPRYNTAASFDVVSKLGRGQFSTVYKAKCKADGHLVALKKVNILEIDDPKLRDDCIQEVDLLSGLAHPNVIRCHAAFVESGVLHIVLEIAECGALSRMVKYFKKESRHIPEKVIWKYFVQLVRGLAHMHEQRVMHRDLKPDNIFVTRDGTVKLGDLGLSRFFSSATSAAVSFVGTPYYMSPERITEDFYDFKSDIWSTGCILYELAALQSPFQNSKTLYTLVKKIEAVSYPGLPADLYSEALRELVHSCLLLSNDDRPSAEKVLEVAEYQHAHFSRH